MLKFKDDLLTFLHDIICSVYRWHYRLATHVKFFLYCVLLRHTAFYSACVHSAYVPRCCFSVTEVYRGSLHSTMKHSSTERIGDDEKHLNGVYYFHKVQFYKTLD